MWSHISWRFKGSPPRVQRRYHILDRRFQLRFIALLLSVGVFCFSLAVVPMLYYTRENYRIFSGLSYQVAPELLSHLERELFGLYLFSASGFIAVIVLCVWLGTRISGRWVAPTKLLRSHLRHLSRGEWYVPPLHLRSTDEFQDLVESYNYFYNTLRLETARDIKALSQLNIDPNNHNATYMWQSLMEEKQKRIRTSFAERPETESDSRRVS